MQSSVLLGDVAHSHDNVSLVLQTEIQMQINEYATSWSDFKLYL